MAIEYCFQEEDTEEDVPSFEKCRSGLDVDYINGCFDCNICLEFARDPVVTLCGHLYCWPCIYKWLHFQRTSTPTSKPQPQQCPVCKANVSQSTLVPLFGRGQTSSTQTETEDKFAHSDLVIPRRPPTSGVHTLINRPQTPSRSYPGAMPTPTFNLGGTTTSSAFNPIIGMFGDMVYRRVFGNPEVSFYSYPNSNYGFGSSSPRVTRQEMQSEKSLNRVSTFLLCCFVMCLLLF